MIGEASGIAPDRGLNILYRVTLNTLMNLTEADLTQSNITTNPETIVNTRLSSDTPKGLLAGSVVAVNGSGTVGAASGVATELPVGVVINNAVGYPFESASGVGSGKCPYLHGSGSVFSTDLYETFQTAGGAAPVTYTAGHGLKVSRNGLLVDASFVETASTAIVGIVLIAPSTSDPFMVVQMLI